MREPAPSSRHPFARARWILELEEALVECDRLLAELTRNDPRNVDAAILGVRVATLRGELRKLAGDEAAGTQLPPEWRNFFAKLGQSPWGKSPPPPKSAR